MERRGRHHDENPHIESFAMTRDAPAPDRGRSVRSHWPMLVIALLLPLGFVALSGWFILDAVRFAASAVKVEATVIDSGRIAREDGDTFRPLFRFEAPDGTLREALAHTAASDYSFARDSTVTVLYDPARPDHVRPHGFWLQYGFWSIFLALGLFVFSAFAFGIGSILRQEPPSPDTR